MRFVAAGYRDGPGGWQLPVLNPGSTAQRKPLTQSSYFVQGAPWNPGWQVPPTPEPASVPA